MKARPRANFPQFWPQTTMATRRNQLNRLVEQMRLGLRLQKWWYFLRILEPRFKRYAYPLPACCLLIACSGVLVTIIILNEMRLDYSPFMQVLPIKRPHSCDIRAPYRDALCAAVMTRFSHLLSARSGSVFRQLRETVCAGYAGCCA